VAIEPGANRYLFEEVNESQLSEKCVQTLNQELKTDRVNDADAETLRLAVRELLKFMTGSSAPKMKVLFSTYVRVAFVHGRQMFIPKSELNRDLLVKVLNVCQTHWEGADGENFSSLIQALFETLPPGRSVDLEDVKRAVNRANTVRKENRNFVLGNNSCSSLAPRSTCRNEVARMPAPSVVAEQARPSSFQDVARRINDVTKVANNISKEARLKKDAVEEFSSIIPETAFGDDDAGLDSCLRPSSTLTAVDVDEVLGGGSLLCDSQAASEIRAGKWDASKCRKIVELRKLLGQAINLIGNFIPSLTSLLGRVRHGCDSANNDYEAFCDGRQIVVNLFSYSHRSTTTTIAGRPTLLNDFILMLTHELAHFLEPNAGHGPIWRDTHMKLVSEIMTKSGSSSGDGRRGCVTCMSCALTG
jgi:hypothetical protein